MDDTTMRVSPSSTMFILIVSRISLIQALIKSFVKQEQR